MSFGVEIALALLILGGVVHGLLYVKVLTKDRNHITQSSLGLIGLLPGIGLFVLWEQLAHERGWITRSPGKEPPASESKKPVGTISQYREKLKDADADMVARHGAQDESSNG